MSAQYFNQPKLKSRSLTSSLLQALVYDHGLPYPAFSGLLGGAIGIGELTHQEGELLKSLTEIAETTVDEKYEDDEGVAYATLFIEEWDTIDEFVSTLEEE